MAKGEGKRTYFTLAIKENGVWSPQFGDYSVFVVREEKRDRYESGEAKIKDMKIIPTLDTQEAINRGIARLNAKG